MPLQHRSVQDVAQVGQREVDVVAALLLLQQCIFAWLGSCYLSNCLILVVPSVLLQLQGCLPHHTMTGPLLSRGQPGC